MPASCCSQRVDEVGVVIPVVVYPNGYGYCRLGMYPEMKSEREADYDGEYHVNVWSSKTIYYIHATFCSTHIETSYKISWHLAFMVGGMSME
jgi:hypothetical protein